MALTQITTGGISSAANITVNTLYRTNLPLVFDDISPQIDGDRQVFSLTVDTAAINTLTDSKDLLVTLNGQILPPYVAEQRWPWIVEYDSAPGYRVTTNAASLSGNVVIFYNQPDPGDTVTVIQQHTSSATQTRKYPFSPTTIGFGD